MNLEAVANGPEFAKERLLTSGALSRRTKLECKTSWGLSLQNGAYLHLAFQNICSYVVALTNKEPLPSIGKTIDARGFWSIVLNGNNRERTCRAFRKRHISSAPRCSLPTEYWIG